jgi:hypothetical protein
VENNGTLDKACLKILSLTPINWNKFEKQFDCF